MLLLKIGHLGIRSHCPVNMLFESSKADAWFAIPDVTSPMPSVCASWCCQGIGHFMLLLLIKQSASIGNGTDIDVYLQSREPGHSNFVASLASNK